MITHSGRRRGFAAGLLAGALALSAAACSSDDSEADTEPTTAGSSVADEPTDSAESPDGEQPVVSDAPAPSGTSDGASSSTLAPEEVPPPSGTLRIGSGQPYPSFDVHADAVGGLTAMGFWRPVYDTLLHKDENEQLQPGLAESWENEDGVLTVTLREGLVFSDGEPLDSAAVVANIERGQANPNLGLDAVEEIVALDDVTVQITLNDPLLPFEESLSSRIGMMMSPASFDTAATAPVGAGGWVLDADASTIGSTAVYQANPTYWDPAAVGVETVEVYDLVDSGARLNALLSGQIDMAPLDGPTTQTAGDAGFEVAARPSQTWSIVVLDRDGVTTPALAEPDARLAISASIDRQTFVDAATFGFGTATIQPHSEGQVGYSEELAAQTGYDPEAVPGLLDSAGYPDGFELAAATIPPLQPAHEVIQGMLAAHGIELELASIAPDEFGASVQTTDYPVFIAPFPIEEPEVVADLFVGEGANLNPFAVNDADVLAARDAYLVATDPAEIEALGAELMETMINSGLIIPIAIINATAFFAEGVEGVVWTYPEQLPTPYGVRVS